MSHIYDIIFIFIYSTKEGHRTKVALDTLHLTPNKGQSPHKACKVVHNLTPSLPIF